MPGWKERPVEEFNKQLAEFVQENDGWVISGNYFDSTGEISWPLASHIVWLNLPLSMVLWQFSKRTFRIAFLKKEHVAITMNR